MSIDVALSHFMVAYHDRSGFDLRQNGSYKSGNSRDFSIVRHSSADGHSRTVTHVRALRRASGRPVKCQMSGTGTGDAQPHGDRETPGQWQLRLVLPSRAE